MTIYELLKNSSPSMARHFKESEEVTKKNTEDITKLETRVTTLETGGSGGSSTPTIYEPFTKLLTGQDGFQLKNKLINGSSYTAYYMYIPISSATNEKFPFTASFAPHCAKYVEQEGVRVYIEVPIMDFEDEVYENPDKLGIAITRGYNSNGELGDIDLLVTKKLWDSLVSESTDMYEVYL